MQTQKFFAETIENIECVFVCVCGLHFIITITGITLAAHGEKHTPDLLEVTLL